MTAQGWSVKGIDPKVREAAREAAARQGMSLGEYLNQALAGQQPGAGALATRARPARQAPPPSYSDDDGGEDDWQVSPGAPRSSDPARLLQRMESIERRTQLAVTGLDRAVSTIDRSVLGLAARIEDAEALSGETAERIAEALEQFRAAGETLSGKLEQAEQEAQANRAALGGAQGELRQVRDKLESQAARAEEVARRAEAAASFLTSEMENREAELRQTLAEARAVAEEAARQAADASADAVAELRQLQETMGDRLAETESSTRRAIADAIEGVRAEAAVETRSTREALLEEVVRLESEIARRVGGFEQLKQDQAELIARIERAEAGARETTAGLRQAAGAAIADLRNAQLTLAARVKQVEDVAGQSGAVDVGTLRQQQQDIAERLAALETKTESSPVGEALAAFERRLAAVESGGASEQKLEHVDGAVRNLDEALQRLSERIAETESTANTAIRTLEETVSSLGARVEQNNPAQETEALRALLENRLDTMAQSVSQMVGEARSELAGQLQAALEGAQGEGLESALTDVNRRLAAAERRQAQTIEAISLEIRRMSETVDKRLRAVEARNDDAAAAAVREELTAMAETLEARFDDIERREASAFDRMGLEVGRLSERLEERVGAVENRSAQAIEHVGEQVARMAERFNQRQEMLSRELGERMLDSEERAGARVAEAIGSIMQRLAEVEQHSAEAIAPVQKAVSSVASKLEQFESAHEGELHYPADAIATPSRRAEDFADFGASEADEYISPMDAAQPLRAGPLPPLQHGEDTYYQETEDDDLLEDADPLSLDDALLESAAEQTPAPPLDIDQPPPHAVADIDFEDDLLIEDIPLESLAGEADARAAPREPDAPLWTPPSHEALPEHPAENLTENPAAPQAEAPPLELTEEPPPSKNDYLANARKAAQAQSLPRTRGEAAPAPKMALRGPSRVILWGAAGAAAALLVGGAFYIKNQAAPAAPGAAPAPETTAPRAAEAPAADLAPVDPAAIAPTPEGSPEAGAAAPAVVAGPLAPRNVTLQQAAQAGDLTAQYELALQMLGAGRTQEGVTTLRRAADRGFPMAQYRLAKLYERGEGVAADLSLARQWTERAAAAGNRRAMHDLGVYFARGEGAPLDEAAAFRWFRQAAELGVADSQYNLGVLYQQGRGVNASAAEALFWFMVAARQGDQDAGARAEALEAQLPAAQAGQARARAEAFRPRASSAAANGEFGPRAWASRPAT